MSIVLLIIFDYPFHCQREEGSFHLTKNLHGKIVPSLPFDMFGGNNIYISAC